MLKNGIYEQIVNTRINKELQQLDREKYDIELEKLDGEDARRILTIYISYVIKASPASTSQAQSFTAISGTKPETNGWLTPKPQRWSSVSLP